MLSADSCDCTISVTTGVLLRFLELIGSLYPRPLPIPRSGTVLVKRLPSAVVALLAVAAQPQVSPGNARSPSRLCLPHLLHGSPDRYWTLTVMDASSIHTASYEISVRQASALLSTAFPHILTDMQLSLC